MRAIIGKPLKLDFIPGWPPHKYVWPVIPEGDKPLLLLTYDIEHSYIIISVRRLWQQWPVHKTSSDGWNLERQTSRLVEPLGYDIDWSVIDGSL